MEIPAEIYFDVVTDQPTIGSVILTLPPGVYTCITARDKLHALRRTVDLVESAGEQYDDFTGDPAKGGN